MASCGVAAGAAEVYQAIQERLAAGGIEAKLEKTGCVGMCSWEPLIEITPPGAETVTYGNVDPKEVAGLLDRVAAGELPREGYTIVPRQETLADQVRIVLRNTGIIDPVSIDDYIAADGYKALAKVLDDMTREAVIDEIKESGLRGRGGAGFPTGLKWQFAYNEQKPKKYVICNADEGDPGAFMDRSVLEGDPHSIIEGMIICAYAIGADEGYLYVRAEYPMAIDHLRKALADAEARGYLGKSIMGSEFNFDLHIKEGAGAFVCGEETALMASIEGERGMPKIRPPFPAQSGLWKYPTNINNVETFANIAWIINNGAAAYNAHGTERSKGTKVFALAGKIKHSGLVEVPMGTPLRDVIYKVGGGMPTEKPFKAVQLGGPSGGCVPASLLDTLVDYDSITKTGAIMGSGGMVVMDTGTCMVDVAKFFLNFTQNESCGKCTFCRVGTKRMLEILERICAGEGRMSDIDTLYDLAENIAKGSLCGLGQTAPNPVLTTLRYFRDEYEAHIRNKRCPAGVCNALVSFTIDADKCVGCTLCARKCPTDAITGEVKKLHVINQELCIKCGACMTACRFGAVIKA
ncbi:MAG: NADH-quinone oxidoreductase subunit NuoF [Candidatus Cloacimonetes bacterium]|nr:NADH-quinone oxidoreductase subunit NuoF [Candidatus Cloacimonadota bacterium]